MQFAGKNYLRIARAKSVGANVVHKMIFVTNRLKLSNMIRTYLDDFRCGDLERDRLLAERERPEPPLPRPDLGLSSESCMSRPFSSVLFIFSRAFFMSAIEANSTTLFVNKDNYAVWRRGAQSDDWPTLGFGAVCAHQRT